MYTRLLDFVMLQMNFIPKITKCDFISSEVKRVSSIVKLAKQMSYGLRDYALHYQMDLVITTSQNRSTPLTHKSG